MNNPIITLAYFQPSASGYDYTDGYIDSDDDVGIRIFQSISEAALFMAKENARVYDKGRVNKPPYQYINTPYFSFQILINGIDRYHQGDYPEDDAEMDIMFEEFHETYNRIFKGLCDQVDEEKVLKENEAKLLQQKNLEDSRRREYENLRKEFEGK